MTVVLFRKIEATRAKPAKIGVNLRGLANDH